MMRFLSLFCVVMLSACVTAPQYHEVKDQSELNANDVNFKVSGLFYRDPPDCVIVMTTKTDGHKEMAQVIEVALARHLGEKVDHVMFPRKRVAFAKRGGYDLESKTDQRRFSLRHKCRFYARAELYDLGDDFVGVFARKHVGVRIDLNRVEDDQPVWQAAHTVWRADGGLPVSPLGAIGGLASAAVFSQDKEIMLSLVDDAMRRMVRTLPVQPVGYSQSSLFPKRKTGS